MKKVSLIFGIATTVCLALIFSGCEQETKTEYTAGATTGAAVDLAGLQKLLDTVDAVDFYGTLAIGTSTLNIPAGKTVTLKDGGVTLDATGVLGVAGALKLPVGEKIVVTGAGKVAGGDTLLALVEGDTAVTVKLYDSLAAATAAFKATDNPVSTAALVNVAVSALTAEAVPTGVTLLVLGDVAISSTAPAPTGNVSVLGRLVFGADADISTYPTGLDYSNATFATSAAAKVKLPGTATITAIDANKGDFTVDGAGTALTVTKLTGNLVLPAALTAVSISGGNVTAPAAIAISGAASFTGTTSFSDTVKFGDEATLGEVSFAGDVTVTDAKALTLTSGKAVSLASGKSIIIDDTTPITVLTASAATVLTPGGATTLTPAKSGKKLTIGVVGLELTSGALAVAADATLDIAAGQTLTVSADTTLTAGKLILGAGAWKASEAAATIETDKLTLGSNASAAFGKDDGTSATVLTGIAATTNTFTASGANVTLAQSTNALSITGADDTAKLATGATAGIKVAAGLTITSATVDISTAATSVITLVNDDTAGITLANDKSIILLDSTKATTATTKPITGITAGTGVTVKAEADEKDKEVGSFTGSDSNNTIVENGSANFSIKKGIKTDAT